uniref:Gustatory receptor n=1 Tax=Culicoides sonorensis TaxID=179676 RepID=A0A336LR12_CULSO
MWATFFTKTLLLCAIFQSINAFYDLMATFQLGIDPVLVLMMEIFSLQLLHQNPKVQICQLFTSDFGLTYRILSTAISFIIILAQDLKFLFDFIVGLVDVTFYTITLRLNDAPLMQWISCSIFCIFHMIQNHLYNENSTEKAPLLVFCDLIDKLEHVMKFNEQIDHCLRKSIKLMEHAIAVIYLSLMVTTVTMITIFFLPEKINPDQPLDETALLFAFLLKFLFFALLIDAIGQTVCLLLSSITFNTEMEKFRKLTCNFIFYQRNDKRLDKYIEIFTLQMLHQRPKIYICELFPSDIGLAYRILSTIAIYVIIIAQSKLSGSSAH